MRDATIKTLLYTENAKTKPKQLNACVNKVIKF